MLFVVFFFTQIDTVYCLAETDFVVQAVGVGVGAGVYSKGQFAGLNSFIYNFNGCLLVSSELIYNVNINHINGGTGDTSQANRFIPWQTGMSILTFDCENIKSVMNTYGLIGEYLNGASFPSLTLAQKQQCHNFQCDLNSNNVLQSCNLHPTTELQAIQLVTPITSSSINRYSK